MMGRKTKQATFILVLSTIFVLMFFCSNQNFVMAEEKNLQPHLHNVILSNSPEAISPSTMQIKQGDTVVWYNKDKEPVIITFIQKLEFVCSPLINFYADESGSYKTKEIPLGGTASLCFIRQGEYDYEVKRFLKQGKEPIEQNFKGKVIVE
jgi:plastocyanin